MFTVRMVAVLAACVATLASAGWGRPKSAAKVGALSFSPDGKYLAVVLGAATSPCARSNDWQTLSRLVVVDAATGMVLWDRDCASSGVGWLSDPIRLVLGTRDGVGLHLVSARPDNGTVGAESGPIGALSLGGIGTRGHLAVAVATAGHERTALYVWDLATNALTRAEVPAGFEASRALPPVIGRHQRIVAVVNEDRSFFLGFDASAHSWEAPRVTARRLSVGGTPTWEWQDVGSALQGEQSWHSGDGLGFQTDRFLVDEASAAIWVAIANTPAGATQVRGRMTALTTHDELVPLDPDEARPVVSAAWRNMSAPRIWREYACSLSCDSSLRHVAVLYRRRGGADCVIYSASTDAGWKENTLVGDAAVATGALSISPTGERVALVQGSGAGQRVAILDVRRRKQVLTFVPRAAAR